MQSDRPNSLGAVGADSPRDVRATPSHASDAPATAFSADHLRGNHGLLVVSLLLLSSIPMGFLAWHRFRSSDRSIAVQVESLRALGRQRTMKQCVDEVLRSRSQCDGLRPLCDGAVGEMMDACIAAADRALECAALGEQTMSTRFGFDDCHARSDGPATRKACAGAYRAIAASCEQLGRTP